MVATSLTDTRVELVNGKAMVEATDLLQENDIKVLIGTSEATIDKNGLYEFSANPGEVMVYDGKATVENGKSHVKLGKGHEVKISEKLKGKHFDTSRRDELYAWSDVRSQYLSQASVYSAESYATEPSSYAAGWWTGADWYWNPWFDAYSFIPADGIFFSSFGWGFYSPWCLGYAPVLPYGGYGGWGRFGYRGAPIIGHVPRFGGVGTRATHGFSSAYNGASHSGGASHVSSGFRGFGGGGFHGGGFGGGGGFHGGGGGGRR